MRVIIEHSDIIQYFEDMNCNECPYKKKCDALEVEINESLCSIITNFDYD